MAANDNFSEEAAEQAAALERSSKRIIPKAAREAAAQAGVKFIDEGVAASGPTAGWTDPPSLPPPVATATNTRPLAPSEVAPPGYSEAKAPGAASAVKVVMETLVELRTRIDALEQWAAEVQTALTFQAGQIDMLGKAQARAAGTPRPKPARDAG